MRKMTSELNLIMKLIIDFNCGGVAGLQNQGSARCVCARICSCACAHICVCICVCVWCVEQCGSLVTRSQLYLWSVLQHVESVAREGPECTNLRPLSPVKQRV